MDRMPIRLLEDGRDPPCIAIEDQAHLLPSLDGPIDLAGRDQPPSKPNPIGIAPARNEYRFSCSDSHSE